MEEIVKLIGSAPGALLVFSLIYLLSRVVERKLDAKTNGHFTADDRKLLIEMASALRMLNENTGDISEHLGDLAERDERKVVAMEQAAHEIKLGNERHEAAALRRWDREMAVIDLTKKVLEQMTTKGGG